MLTSLKQLLTAIVDYAGLFPPAQLRLSEALAEYDRAQSSPYGWMVDRVVLPATCLPELPSAIDKLLPSIAEETQAQKPWLLSVILSHNWAAELEQVHSLIELGCDRDRPIKICAVEVAPLPPAAIPQVCLHLPADVTAFFEIPFDADLGAYLNGLQHTGAAAKLRTGGVSDPAFPNSSLLSQRILALADAHVPFKATAGLHHPLRGRQPFTNQPDSAFTTMHGFLNVAIAAALASEKSIPPDAALAVLEASTIAEFRFTDTAICWQNYSLSLAELARSRQQFFRSFGSCSFQEPIADLHALRLL